MTTQKQAVYLAVMSVLGDLAINFDDGQKPTAKEILKEKGKIKDVVAIVMAGFEAFEVDLKEESRAKFDTTPKLETYTKGMVDNHLRKDKRLNGDVDYEAKNPGSRAASGDSTLKEMKKLADKLKGQPQQAVVLAAIKDHEATLAAAKAKANEIDVSKLPAHLRDLIAKPVVDEATDEDVGGAAIGDDVAADDAH